MNFEFSKAVDILFNSHDAMSLLELIDHMNTKYKLYETYELFSWEFHPETKDFAVFNNNDEQLAMGITTEFELPEFELIFAKNEFDKFEAFLGFEMDEHLIETD